MSKNELENKKLALIHERRDLIDADKERFEKKNRLRIKVLNEEIKKIEEQIKEAKKLK